MHNQFSSQITNQIINQLDERIWRGVAAQNLKKLAPSAVYLEGNYIIDSFMNISLGNKEKLQQLHCQVDPTPAQIDALATGVMESEMNEIKDNLSSIQQGHQRLSTNQSGLQKKIKDSLSQVKSTKSKNNVLFQIEFQQADHEVYDSEEERLRNMILRKERQEKQLKIRLRQQEQEQLQKMVKNKKLLKELKKYTYDYEGKFFALGNSDPGKQKIMKILNKHGQMKLLTKQFKKPQQSNIQNDKLKQRQMKALRNRDSVNTLLLDDRPESLIDPIEKNDKISEGVKITANKDGESIVKEQKRPKLSGMKKYRRNQYKNMMKDRKFVQHKYPGSSATINAPQQIILMSKKPEQKKQRIKTRSEKSLDQSKTIQGLPPLKNSSFKSSKLFSDGRSLEKGLNSRFSGQKSKINIDDEQLYSVNFYENTLLNR